MAKTWARIVLLAMASFWIIWPLSTMVEEGFRIDLGPLYSGRGQSFVGKFFQGQGGIRPNPIVFLKLLTVEAFPRLVLNSSVIAALSIGISLAVGIPAAYALARYKFSGKALFTSFILILRTISPFALIVPFFIAYGQLGLFDTYLGMALVYLVINIPIVTLMLRGFFSDIPKSIYEAASTSGASEFTILRKVALPLIIPGLIATVIFAFVATWNEFTFAQFLSGISVKTVSRAVWTGFGESIESFRVLDFDELNAGGTLAILPALVLSLLIKKYMARGLSLGTTR
ncbi:MAG: carbohydrate ABC transporter permease [Thaumarchaeota archaeon]|nr:carbohydrate ABC transporter permease [Nitrososphaerota archaeon]